jgi:glutathione synthase
LQASSRQIGVIMDPVGSINIKKDSTFAMLMAAQRRGWAVHYMEQSDLWLEDGRVLASTRALRLREDPEDWYTLGGREERPLGSIEAVLMRKDPPFDMEYVYTTYLLELAAPKAASWSIVRTACATPTRNSSPPGSRSAARRHW